MITKDYGSEFPVQRFPNTRQYVAARARIAIDKAQAAFWRFIDRRGVQIGAGLACLSAIVVFFGLFALSIHLLPGAIDDELQRQVAVVEKHLRVSK